MVFLWFVSSWNLLFFLVFVFCVRNADAI
jgi:hypothetical protein